MTYTRILYFLLAFCGTVSQGLWINPLGAEAILIVDIPLFFLFVLGISTKSKDPKSNIILALMIIFLLWPIVGAFSAVNQQVAFVNMITNLRAFLIALAIMRYVNTKKEMEYLMIGIGAGLLFQGMIALYQFRFGYAGFGFLGEGAATWRTSGTLGHPNVLAMSILVLQFLSTKFNSDSLTMKGREYQIGKLYSLPDTILALNSNFIAISSSSVISDVLSRKSWLIRPSFFISEINVSFLSFLLDTLTSACYITYV